MMILVCPLSHVTDMIATHAPERIVSLLDPDVPFPDAGAAYVHRHLRLGFHDMHVPTAGYVLPSATHVDALVAFLTHWERTAPLLMHCRAGIGRSTAAAFIAACLHNPLADEWDIATALRRASPRARPNERLIALADAALRRNGRMRAAIAETGRGLSAVHDGAEGAPFAMPCTFQP